MAERKNSGEPAAARAGSPPAPLDPPQVHACVRGAACPSRRIRARAVLALPKYAAVPPAPRGELLRGDALRRADMVC